MLAESRQDVSAREPSDGHYHYGLAEIASLTLFLSTLLIVARLRTVIRVRRRLGQRALPAQFSAHFGL